MRRRRGNSVVAVFLMALGGWLIASSLGVALPGLGQLWPAFLAVYGLAMLAQAAGGGPGDEGPVFVGIGATLTGAFLFLFTLGVLQWRDMAAYWPAFPLIGGVSFFALYLAGGMRDTGLLVPAFAAGGVGVVAFPFTLGAVQNAFVNRVARLWPVFVILLGMAFLFRPSRRGRPVRRGRGAPLAGEAPAAETPSAGEGADEPPADETAGGDVEA